MVEVGLHRAYKWVLEENEWVLQRHIKTIIEKYIVLNAIVKNEWIHGFGQG